MRTNRCEEKRIKVGVGGGGPGMSGESMAGVLVLLLKTVSHMIMEANSHALRTNGLCDLMCVFC